MSLKIDRLQLEIIINNDQARKSLRLLDDEARAIQKSMKGMKEGTDEWIQATKRLSSIKNQMDSIQDSIGIAGLSMKELIAKQKELNMVLSNISPGLPQYKELQTTLGQVNSRITELRGNIKDASGVLKEQGGVMSQVFDKMGKAVLELGTLAAAAFSLEKIGEYFKGGIESALKLRDTEDLLLEELNGNKAVQTDLIKLAKERAGSTMYSRQEMEEAEKFLAIQERTPEQIKKTILAATNLATLTGGTLEDAVKELDATMEGKLGKSLGKLEKDFKGLTKEQMYNGAAIDIVASKYAGLAEREMNTTEGRINLLGKAWRGLQRTIGDTVLDSGSMFNGIIQGATSLLNTFRKIIEVPLSEKLKDEQERVNFLAASITDANLSAEDRNKLYKELETLAPTVTKGLDEENLSYQKLTANLSLYNDEMVNKIIIQKESEKVDNANDDLAKARMKRVEIEQSIIKNSTDYVTSLKLKARKQNKDDAEETFAIVKKFEDVLMSSVLNNRQKIESLNAMYKGQNNNSYMIALNNENSAQAKVNLQLKAKSKLMTDLGLNSSHVATTIVDDNKKASKEILDLTKMTKTELQKYIDVGAVMGASQADKHLASLAKKELNRREGLSKAYEQYMDLMREIADLEKTNFAEKLSQTQSEIKAVNDKYNNEIKKIDEFKEHNKKTLSSAENKELDRSKGDLEIARDAQTKQILEQAEKDFADKITLIHENLRVARMTITGREVYEINKKYDELQKEILDAIEYRYQQEISEAHGNAGKILLAEKNKADELTKMQGDLSKLELARQEETNKAKKSGEIRFEEELKALKTKADIDLAKDKEKIALEVEAKYKKILEEAAGNEIEIARITKQKKEELNAKLAAAEEEAWKKKFESIKKWAEFAINQLSGLSSAWMDYQNGILQRDEANAAKQKDTLKKQLDGKLISQKQYDNSVAKLDAEADKKKRKITHDQAVIAKATNVASAIINTAVAITSVLSIPILGEALAIIVGLLGAAQIALILATPIPQAASGRYNVIGKQDGKAYNDVPYQSSFTGIPGRPMLVNETGNEIVIDPYTTRNIQLNYPYIIEGINQARVPQRAGGYYPDAGAQKTTANVPVMFGFDPATLNALDKFQKTLEKPIGANIIYDNIIDSINRVSDIQGNVTR